jgi:potassium-transporting ATPase KdpC subunit
MLILREFRPAISLVIVFTILTGVLLPEVFTGIMQAVLPYQANGSQIMVNNQLVGSALIGQNFTSSTYFQPRPSALTGTNAKGATIPTPYDASESGASNLAPTSAALQTSIQQRVAAYIKAFGPGPVPADAVTSSGSGLDADISLANALRQAPAVAAARHLPASAVVGLVQQMTHPSFLGIVGTDHVNVLQLNLALNHLSGAQNLAQGTPTAP